MKDQETSDGIGTCVVASMLLLAAPLVAFLTTNQYPLLRGEVWILLAACVLGGLVLGWAAVTARVAAALLFGVGAALAIDLMYHLQSSKPLRLLVPLVCLVLAWILRRHIALVMAASLFVFLATTLLVPGPPGGEPAKTAGGIHVEMQTKGNALPVVLHLILDEHIGIDGLPQELPESGRFRRWLTNSYVRLGFRVYTGAYSEYFHTQHYISNLLNFTSSSDKWAHQVEGREKPYLLKDSAYFRHLSGLGYRLYIYQSDFMDFCRVPSVSYAACSSYSIHKIGSLVHTSLGNIERARFIVNSFVAGSYYLSRIRAKYVKLRASLRGWPLPAWGQGTTRVGPIPVLPVLKQLESDLRSASRGNAYFAHLLIPHNPYVLDESCRMRDKINDWLYRFTWQSNDLVENTADTRAERYRRYFAQIRCQQRFLEKLFDAMQEAGVWDDAIIVIHGDHGSRIIRNTLVAKNVARLTQEDFRDAFSTLFAIRMPGQWGGVVRGDYSLQLLLSEAFQLPIDRSPVKVYLRAADGNLSPVYGRVPTRP